MLWLLELESYKSLPVPEEDILVLSHATAMGAVTALCFFSKVFMVVTYLSGDPLSSFV
jgi:hypothetical protein